MHPTFRRAAIAAVVVASMAPGLVQGSSFHGSSRIVAAQGGQDVGFLSAVWSLLTEMLTGRIPVVLPGVPMTAKDTTDPGDNGGRLDPSGTPSVVTPPPSPNS
jgi:hypothetical protein